MGTDNPVEFGPKSLSEQEKDLKDMDKEKYDTFHQKMEEEKTSMRNGYDRIKEKKVKSVYQDYWAAVNKGTRSGSGKIVQDNFQLLTYIWGGSPATTSLAFGVDARPPVEGGETIDQNLEEENSEGTIGILYSAILFFMYHHYYYYY